MGGMPRRLAALAAALAVAVGGGVLAGCGVPEDAAVPSSASLPSTATTEAPPVVGAQPSPSGLIVFTSPREDVERLHAVLANGFAPHPLAGDPSVDASDPAFSPDGALLVWVGRRGDRPSIWISAGDGTLAEELDGTEGGTCPSWGADSRRVLYLAGAGTAEPALRVAGLDGRTITISVPFPAEQLGCGAFLPGDRVVVERRTGPSTVELWTFAVGSADPDRLVAMPGCEILDPVPSPEGTLVGFTTMCTDPAEDGLWMVPGTGGTPAPVLRGDAGPFGWSPDARWFVYAWAEGGAATELRIADTDGSDVRLLVEAPSGWPTWAPPRGGTAIAP